MKNYKNCQSCGMPLKKDPKRQQNITDSMISNKYCSYCYEDGEFKQPDWNANQMRDFVKGKLKEMGFPGFLTEFFTRGIPNLERWKK